LYYNNFLLTNGVFKRLSFSFFNILVLVRTQIRFRFRCCTEPTTEVTRLKFIRIANDANPSSFVSFFSTRRNPG
jgi:hypothetical protein